MPYSLTVKLRSNTCALQIVCQYLCYCRSTNETFTFSLRYTVSQLCVSVSTGNGRLMESLLHNDTHLVYSSLGSDTHRNTEDPSISPLGGRQLELLIPITQLHPLQLIHTLYTLTKHFPPPLICYIHTS